MDQRPNRTGFYWFKFGSVRLHFVKAGSSSVRLRSLISIDEEEIEELVDVIKKVNRIE